MNLADFVQTTLEEILKGVRAAQHPGVISTSNLGIINPGEYQDPSRPRSERQVLLHNRKRPCSPRPV